jgi:ribonuclease HI
VLNVRFDVQANIPRVKAFHTQSDAQAFIDGKNVPSASSVPGEQKFYAVQQGHKPGVYTDWPSAQAQIRGVSHPRHKKFNSRAEAEAFVAEGKQKSSMNGQTTLTPDEEIRQLIVKKSAPGLQVNGTYQPRDKNGDPYEIGTGPLPPGAEDGFDPNIRMDENGALVHKTEEEKAKTKLVPVEKSPPSMLRIFTDGSSLRNGTAGARAGVGVYFGPQDPKYDDSDSPPPSPGPLQTQTVYTINWAERQALLRKKHGVKDEERAEPKLTNWRYRNVSEALKGSKQTNQRAELTAIQRALDVAPRHRDVTIYTDSKYAIDCVTNWYRNWVRNGWVNSKGKPVENKDLVMGVRENIEEREILGKKTYFVWVKGHANNEGNIAADQLAVEGARMGRGLEDDEEEDKDEDDDESREDDTNPDDTITATLTTEETGTNGASIPEATSEESEDVKMAYQDMARAMEDDEKQKQESTENGYH